VPFCGRSRVEVKYGVQEVVIGDRDDRGECMHDNSTSRRRTALKTGRLDIYE
jgi:hypothetical protein